MMVIIQSGAGVVGKMVDAETAEQLAFKDSDMHRYVYLHLEPSFFLSAPVYPSLSHTHIHFPDTCNRMNSGTATRDNRTEWTHRTAPGEAEIQGVG